MDRIKKFLKNKKAQITVFMIIGVILLFSTAVILSIRQSMQEAAITPVQEAAPLQIQPVQLFVVKCVQDTLKDGLKRLGSTGGYVDVNKLGVKINPLPYNSESYYNLPYNIPYWWYYNDNKDMFSSWRPPLHKTQPYDTSIEGQLDAYIKENLPKCIGDFSNFKNLDIEAGEISVDTKVNKADVVANVNYPLTLTGKTGQFQAQLSKFGAKESLHLGEIYDLATEILNAESQDSFLEYKVMNLIVMQSGVDKNKFPPISSFQATGGQAKVFWVKQKVEKRIKEEILPFVRLTEIANTRNFAPAVTSNTNEQGMLIRQGFLNLYNIKLSDNQYRNTGVEFWFPQNSQIYLNINDQELIQPQAFDPGKNDLIMRMVGVMLQDYRFDYDIKAPILMKLNDPTAFNGEGYDFLVSFEINIEDNVPKSIRKPALTMPAISPQLQISFTNPLVYPPAKHIIRAYNNLTGQPLDGVEISYHCGKIVLIGTTEMINNESLLKTQLPLCLAGGSIIYRKEGYLGGSIPFNNAYDSTPNMVKVNLLPSVQKKIIIAKIDPSGLEHLEYVRQTAPEQLETQFKSATNVKRIASGEEIYLNINRISDDPFQDPIPLMSFILVTRGNKISMKSSLEQQKASINNMFQKGVITAEQKDNALKGLNEINVSAQNTQTTQTQEEYTVELVPGTYELNAFLLATGSPLAVWEQKITKYCPTVICLTEDAQKTIEMPRQEIDAWNNGGLMRNVTFSKEDIYNNDKSTLYIYVIDFGTPQSWDEVQAYSADVSNTSIKYQDILTPQFRVP